MRRFQDSKDLSKEQTGFLASTCTKLNCTKLNCIMIVKQLVYKIMINLQIIVYICTKLNCIID